MITVSINDIKINVKANSTILQACEQADVYIPRFCYHDKLSIAGNCRMCLVEVEKSPKPVVSCAFPVMNNMKIYTNTPLVKKARENVLEFLLLNHPLDCPICDQGGECDLQDQTLVYGSDKSRFYEYKRGVENKNCGPLIKTIMTRCIHCTRCVRFMTEMTNFQNLGTTNRGTHTEIGTYFERFLKTEISGNVVDLCPVGALTSKPYSFVSRPWELKSTNNIDIMDGIGSNIRVDSKDSKILRILPRLNNDINDNWISDKTRFFFDGLQYQRLSSPLFFDKKSFTFVEIKWSSAFNIIKTEFLKIYHKFLYKNVKSKSLIGSKIGIIVGNLIDLETASSIKTFAKKLKINNIINLNNNKNNTDFLENCNFNEVLSNIDKYDTCLLLGTNTRLESSIYNLKILNQVKKNKLKVYYIGPKVSLNYKAKHLGNSLNILMNISEGKHSFCKILKKSSKPLIIYGNNILERKDYNELFFKNILLNLKNTLLSIKILNTDTSDINCLNLNIKPAKNSIFNFNKNNGLNICNNIDVLYLIGVDTLPFTIPEHTFVIYQNSHGNKIAQKADLILPSEAIFEKESTYCNIEGRVQKSYKVINNINAKKDSNIINFLYKFLIKDVYKKSLLPKPFNIKNTFFYSPNLVVLNKLSNTFFNKKNITKFSFLNKVIINSIIKVKFSDFYKTNIITKSSLTMTKCSKTLQKLSNFK